MSITTGKWEVIEGSVFAKKKRILWGSCVDVPLSEMEPNLKLASAAPEMHEALKAIIAECPDPHLPYGKAVVAIACKALAKAEGRE